MKGDHAMEDTGHSEVERCEEPHDGQKMHGWSGTSRAELRSLHLHLRGRLTVLAVLPTFSHRPQWQRSG